MTASNPRKANANDFNVTTQSHSFQNAPSRAVFISQNDKKKNKIWSCFWRPSTPIPPSSYLPRLGHTAPCHGRGFLETLLQCALFAHTECTAFWGSELSLLTACNPTWEVDRLLWFAQSSIASQSVHKSQPWAEEAGNISLLLSSPLSVPPLTHTLSCGFLC